MVLSNDFGNKGECRCFDCRTFPSNNFSCNELDHRSNWAFSFLRFLHTFTYAYKIRNYKS
jgi:hypothetical protein